MSDTLTRRAKGMLILACLAPVLPVSSSAQDAGHFAIRAGYGADISGRAAYGGQVEYSETSGSNSVEVAIAGFQGRLTQEFSGEPRSGVSGIDRYREETEVVGIGIMANYLLRHSLDVGGPYFVVGAGVSSFSVDWREESDTDSGLGTPVPGGGSFREKDGLIVGSVFNFGIGQRLSRHLDLRAQLPTLVVAESDPRGLKLIPVLTLTAAIGF